LLKYRLSIRVVVEVVSEKEKNCGRWVIANEEDSHWIHFVIVGFFHAKSANDALAMSVRERASMV